jgi:asparagine synthetase B (glutamine-hydrolysing)
MCGIVTLYSYGSDSSGDRDELVCMRERMAVRGPDDHGA